MSQLDIFHQSSGEPPTAVDGQPQQPPVTPAADLAPAELAGSPDTPDDDGSLHWMMTGKPEPKALRISVCRNCGVEIIWARTERDRKMPLDAAPVAFAEAETRGLYVLREPERSLPLAIAAWGLEGTEPHYRCHFDTCTKQAA